MKSRIMPMIVSAALAASVIGSSSALAESGKAEYGSLTVTVYNEDEGGLYTDERTSFMICGGPDENAAPGMAGAVFLCDVTPSESNPFVMNDIYISDNFKYTIVDSGSPDYDGFNYRIDYERSDRTFKFTEDPDQDLSIYMKKNYFVVSSDKSVTVATHGQDIADNVWTVIHRASELINSDDFKALDTADRIREAKELMESLSDEELIADYAFDEAENVMNFTYKHGTITGQLRPAVFEDEHKQLETVSDTTGTFPVTAQTAATSTTTVLKGTKSMTLDDVKELAKKGDILDWSDFEEYVGEDGWHGIGMYTHTYSFDLGDGFVLYVGGNQPDRPETILLYRYDPENGIDIRKDGIDGFIYITADHTMTVEVMEVSGDTLMVRSADGSGEMLTLPAKYLDSDVVPKAGMKLEVTYVGGILETYPAQFGEVKKVTVLSDNTSTVKGDANCDGRFDLADAILIMQALANPNKYGIDGTAEHHLTSLGRIKADMDGNGLTVDDALAIQLKLLGLSDNTSDADITVFGLTPSKTGVKEFFADNPTVKSSYQGDELFNVTPKEITDRYNFRIFKYSSDCESYLEYNGKTYHIGTGFGGPGTVSFAVADIDANGSPELYFTYSFGSGIHASDISYFDFATETVSELEFYYERGLTDQSFGYELRDLAFAVDNNRLEIYSAVTNGNSFVELEVELKEKLGEIIADNGAIKAAGQGIGSSLIANKLFIYEKETALGAYDISFGDNGKYYCNQGNFDAARDWGTWTISGNTVVLTGQFGTNRLSFKDNALIYIEDGSDGFGSVKPKDGEKFTLAPERTYDAKTMSMNGVTISIKTDFRPNMSDMSGIGILIEVDSPNFPVTLKAADGYFRIDDTEKGEGRFINVGKTCEAGKSGRIFWDPDELYYQEGFESEIQVIGVSGDVFIDLGRIYIAQVKGGIFEASF